MENKKVNVPKKCGEAYLAFDSNGTPEYCVTFSCGYRNYISNNYYNNILITSFVDLKDKKERTYVIPDITPNNNGSISLAENCIDGHKKVTIVYGGRGMVVLDSFQYGKWNDYCNSCFGISTEVNLVLPEDMAFFHVECDVNCASVDFAVIAPKDIALKNYKGKEVLPCTEFKFKSSRIEYAGITHNQDLVYNRETQEIEPRTAELSVYAKSGIGKFF